MRKVLLVVFVGMVLAMSLYGLTAEKAETENIGEAAQVVYVE